MEARLENGGSIEKWRLDWKIEARLRAVIATILNSLDNLLFRSITHPFCFKNWFIQFCVTFAIIIASRLFLFIKSRDSLHFNRSFIGKQSGVLHSGVLTIRGLTIRGSYNQGFLQSGVLTIRGSYNQGFKWTCITWRVCAQMLILIVKSYDQGSVLIVNF